MNNISVRELNKYIGNSRYLIIDLRSNEEYQQGHIQGAKNVPMGKFRHELEKGLWKEIILYCDRGGLSMSVARELEEQGFLVKNLIGGYQAYRKAALE